MHLKIIQVNVYMGKYLRDLVDFLNREKPDIVTMEEVTTEKFNLWRDHTISLFDLICKETGLKGVYDPVVTLRGNSSSTLGNAVISRFDTVKKEVIVLKKFRPITVEEFRDPKFVHLFPKEERHLLDLCLSVAGRNFHVICWHGAWVMNAEDSLESLRQAKIVANHLKIIKEPFILGCDLNVGPKTRTVDLINREANNLVFSSKGKNIVSKVSKNWVLESKIKRTTHPVVHKTVGILPDGLLVDYIFTSKHFKLKSIEAPEVLVSDHLPLVANLELEG